ncbi:MAG TPA: DUF3090 family protein [Acidimicrobiales bacterium]|nr:DUF3090 family protein [Acidimicrobiales bacterium]
MSESFDLGPLDHITVGTVGEPGQRVFLLQARRGADLVTLKVEKGQVAALAQYLAEVIEAAGHPGALPTDLDLIPPYEPSWAVGTLGVSYDEDAGTVIIVAEEAVAEDESGAIARLEASLEQVAALAIHGVRLVESGRPPCPLCGYPLNPDGHNCPRTNGHRPPAL